MRKREQSEKQESKGSSLFELFGRISDEEESKYRRLIDGWKKRDRQHWNNKISTFTYPNPQAKDIDIIIRQVNENFTLDREDNLSTLTFISYLGLMLDKQAEQLRSLTSELRAIGVLKKELKETRKAVRKREKLFKRIGELYNPRLKEKQSVANTLGYIG
jgi:hypothetical protein